MRTIAFAEIATAVEELCLRACRDLPADVEAALVHGVTTEASPLGRELLQQCVDNARIARDDRLPICQDTGLAIFFVERGEDLRVDGDGLEAAIAAGVRAAYGDGLLRKSVVADPLFERRNTGDNCPPVVHLSTGPGDGLRIRMAPKGGGSENMSRLAMLRPADGRDGVIQTVLDALRLAGGNPCPPVVVGVGIGGSAETAMLLAKRALLRPLGHPHADGRYAALEAELLGRINGLGIGPQGLGGTTTALAVHIEHQPCHIASLPVAVNLNCHAARHQEVTW